MTHRKFISDSGLCRGRPPTLVLSSEFRVQSFEFRVQSFEFRVLSSEFRVLSSELNIRDIVTLKLWSPGTTGTTGTLKLHRKRPRDWPCLTCSVIPGNGENRDNDRRKGDVEPAGNGGNGRGMPLREF